MLAGWGHACSWRGRSSGSPRSLRRRALRPTPNPAHPGACLRKQLYGARQGGRAGAEDGAARGPHHLAHRLRAQRVQALHGRRVERWGSGGGEVRWKRQ